MNANLAEYHVPVNADVPSLEAILVEEHDPHVNALGIKGVGEIGITGSAGADRQRGLARDRDPGARVPDHPRQALGMTVTRDATRRPRPHPRGAGCRIPKVDRWRKVP